LLDFLESHKNKLVYLPLIIYWIILFIATSLPGNDLPNLRISDKIEHFVAYFILAVFLNFALILQTKFKWLKQKANIATILIISIYAGLDELHQIFIPGRSCDFRDWITDFMATCLAVLLINMLIRQIKNKAAK
jgi:VanZ family protein